MTGGLLGTMFIFAASAFNEVFDQANEAYNAGDYATAIEHYEQLVQEDIANPAVFFNLGNAYYKSGRLGPAIANYERALQLDPKFESAAENLSLCLGKTKRQLARPSPPKWERLLLFWHYGLSPVLTRTLAIMLWLAFWGVLAARQFRAFSYARLLALVVGVLAAAFAVSAWAKSHPPLLAVASEQTVPARYTPEENGTVRFELFEGDRVLVDRQENGWARVVTGNQERGWVQEQHLTFVGPPYERAPTTEETRGREAAPQ